VRQESDYREPTSGFIEIGDRQQMFITCEPDFHISNIGFPKGVKNIIFTRDGVCDFWVAVRPIGQYPTDAPFLYLGAGKT